MTKADVVAMMGWALLAASITGCALIASDNGPTRAERIEVIVYEATRDVVRESPERKEALLTIASKGREALSFAEEITVDDLYKGLADRLPWDRFSMTEAVTARLAMLEIKARLEKEFGDEELSEEGRIYATKVISWMERAAE